MLKDGSSESDSRELFAVGIFPQSALAKILMIC